jgi:hypothetical protein
MTLYWLALGFKAAAALLAFAVARRSVEHRPLGWLLGGTTIADVTRLALLATIIRPARDAARDAGLDPSAVLLDGWARIACIADSALFLAWFAGLAALSLWLFLRRRPWPVAVVYGLAVLALVIGYPALRHGALQRFYLAAELAALCVGLGSLARWIGREAPRLPHVAAACVLATDLATLVAGPWRFNVFGAWSLALVMYAALYATLVVLQAGALWISPTPSRPSSSSSR